MDREDVREADVENLNHGYATQGQFVSDLMAWLDLSLYYYYCRHQWLGPSSELKNMLGVVVTREEFEHNLTKSALRGLSTQLSAEEKRQLYYARRTVLLRVGKTTKDFPALSLFRRFGLDSFQRSCVILAWAVELDKKYERLFAYLQDDMSRKAPERELAAQLFLPDGEELEACMARFNRPGGFLRLFEHPERGALVLRPAVMEYLSTGTVSDRPGRTFFRGATQTPSAPLLIHHETARRLDAAFTSPDRLCILLSGAEGSGKRFQIEHLFSRQKKDCVFADVSGEDALEKAQEAALAADLTGAYLCLRCLDDDGDAARMDALETLELLRDKRFFLSRNPLHGRMKTLSVELEIPPVTEEERLTLFQGALSDSVIEGCTAEELAAKFRFQPAQIRLACTQAAGLARLEGNATISASILHRCCYAQAVHRLGDLASAVPPAYTWDDVVLPEAQKRLLREACDHIQYRHQVYYQWGFGKKVTYGRGLSILMAGSPGTGKTMCAQVIAHQLNMELYKINLSQIVSKYIGETEKNLRAVFQEARRANCILFFDECDALFGKRSEVKDAHDRNANVEVAYLLQQIEEYDGVCLLATNLIGNIDEAFMRRMTYVVRFPFPDPPTREEIYRRMIPPSAPVEDDIDWAFLAKTFELSGGYIKNIALSAAFLAAGEGVPISMRHMLRAAVNELKKNEIVVVREQLREYADLLDD